MSRLHIFIDGSWLYKACAPERALSARLECPDRRFPLNFERLCLALLRHVSTYDAACDQIGDKFLSTSIFSIPENFHHWPEERDDITRSDVSNIRGSVLSRERFVKGALSVGFDPSAVYRPPLKGWMVEKLRDNRFQEKQVDATVVALVVRSAILNARDYHVIVTGDEDMLPAVKVAHQNLSENVFVATTHASRGRRALADFDYRIAPYFLDEHTDAIAEGENIYACVDCSRVFSKSVPLYKKQRRLCDRCRTRRKTAAAARARYVPATLSALS